MKMNAAQLRDVEESEVQGKIIIPRNPIYLILENVYDTYNIGGLFRLADALAVEKMYLCGEMETPPNHKIAKASIGTYKIVPWEYKNSTLDVIKDLREKDAAIKTIAVEQDKRALNYTKADYVAPVALIVGNETFGVLPETLDAVDQIVEIPMWGINKSLNVIVSAAIVSFYAMKGIEQKS